MLETLKPFYSSVPVTRNIPQWDMFVQQVGAKRVTLTDRYLNQSTVPPMNGLRALEKILRIADPKMMAEKYNNFYILTTQVPWILQDVKQAMALSNGGKTYTNLFAIAMGSTPAKEYVIPPDDNDWLKYLPVHVTDYASWREITPLTLWWHDSPEQTFDLFSSGYLRFHADPPTFVYWILDIPTLILKAVQYFRAYPRETLSKFIQTEVIGKITAQEERCWLFMLHVSALLVQLGYVELEKVLSYYRQRQTQFSYIGPKLDDALRDILNVYADVQRGALRAINALSIPFFERMSFSQIASSIPLKYNLSHYQQYQALRLFRDIPLLDYLVLIYSLNMNDPLTRQFKDRFRVLLVKWLNTVPLSSIKNEAQRNWIQEHMEGWKKFCEMQ